jgi:hypothetical protein
MSSLKRIVCVEDLFQTVKTDDFESLFSVLEDIIKLEKTYDDKTLNPLLRICNSILNKLSATSHTDFIGRIHKLIIDVFPCSHKSGVNFKGLYNERMQLDTNEKLETEGSSEVTLLDASQQSTTDKLSFEFFQNFWLLQKYIANPFQVWFA